MCNAHSQHGDSSTGKALRVIALALNRTFIANPASQGSGNIRHERAEKKSKSQRMGAGGSAMKCYLLDMARPLPYLINSSLGYLHNIKPVNIPAPMGKGLTE